MKFGDKNNYLEIIAKSDDHLTYFYISAKVTERRGTFSGENTGVVYGGGEQGVNAIRKFENYETNDAHIILSEDCYLHLFRNNLGSISINFQISVIVAGEKTTMNGSTGIDGEYAQSSITKLANYFYKCV